MGSLGLAEVALANQNLTEGTSIEPVLHAGGAGSGCGSWARGVRLEILGNLAHELRTPLQVMLGYLDILRDECAERLDNEPREMLDRMNASAHQMAHTVENILEFARADAGADTRACEEVAIHELIDELCPTFEAANESKGLVLKFQLSDAPARILSQRRAVRLIVQNLVLNAIKFTAAGTVTVALRRWRPTSVSADGVEIEVRDTGSGISPVQIELACQPFTQLSATSVRRYRGVGLGLAVVRRNVSALGGTFEAHSTAGIGSAFIVRIPGWPRDLPIPAHQADDDPANLEVPLVDHDRLHRGVGGLQPD
jgi:signal transduction histidine kinase